MRSILALVAAAGCYSPQGEPACSVLCSSNRECPGELSCNNGVCGPCNLGGGDGGVDSTDGPDIDAPASCYGNNDLIFCPAMSSQTLTLLGAINTDTDSRCQQLASGVVNACVLAFENIIVGGVTAAIGSRALVLVASKISVTSTGALDVSAVREVPGPGGRSCPSSNGAPGANNGGGGGGGGSYGARGGAGGTGTGATGGMPSNPAPAGVYGGCAGGNGTSSLVSGRGGGGGGIAILIATTSVEVEGFVKACGGSGTAITQGGGGGGGSGGSIVIITPTFGGVSPKLFAIGGGGAAGVASGVTGNGRECDVNGDAIGGTAQSSSGGDGGDGHVTNTYGGNGLSGSTGGGGGGGGAGRIDLRVTAHSATNPLIYPPAQ